MTQREAEAENYSVLAGPYRLPNEQWMMDAVVADMQRGGIETAFVRFAMGTEVWRRSAISITEE